ncbi:MAG: DNA recombination protein RmuC [Alphaproteobacteria bacterium]|nr:DNA recombination protein RmuC [Alphaproteobacteria bacterium]
MTTYIFVLLVFILFLLLVLVFRKPTIDMAPLHEDNTRLRERISEKLGILAQNALELKSISGDIANFKNLLMGNKQARGSFGERQLEDLIADILPPENYAFQSVLSNGVRPDCIIRLPYPPGDMIIDSKFPLESYNNLQENTKDTFLQKQFENDVKKHIDDISEKYVIPGMTAESAMMFIASESIFADIHRSFPKIIDYAARKKVFLVSPSTLWASLNTIRAVLSDIKIKRVAKQIKTELTELLADVARLQERTTKIRSHFNSAKEDIDNIEISMNKITPRAEKIKNMNFDD